MIDRQLIFSSTVDPNLPGFPATVSERFDPPAQTGQALPFGSNTRIDFTEGASIAIVPYNGVMKIYKAGTYTIGVRQNNGQLPSGVHGSRSFTVLPSTSEVMKLDLSSPQVNGTAFANTNDFTLTVIYNNPVMTRPVTFTTSLPGVITINGGNNVVNTSGGPSTNLTPLNFVYQGAANATGVFTATVRNPLGNLVSVTDSVFVSHAAPTLIQLRGASPTDAYATALTISAGQPISLMMRLVDSSGNVALNEDVARELKFTVSPAPAGGATVTESDGTPVATNSNLDTTIQFNDGLSNVSAPNLNGVFSLAKVGTYTLTATATTPAVTTQAGQALVVTVEPGPAYTLTLNLDAMTQVNNQPFGGVNTITLFDRNNNPVPGLAANERVTLTVTSHVTGVVNMPGAVGAANVLVGADFAGTNAVNLSAKGLTYRGLVNPAPVTIRATLLRADGSQVSTLANVTVGPGALAYYVLDIPDAPAAAGTPLASTLVAKDLSGNTIVGLPAQLLTFTGGLAAPDLTPPTIDQGGDKPFDQEVTVSFTSGQAALNVKLFKADAQNIQVVQGSITSNVEAVTVQPAAHAAFEVAITSPQPLTDTFTVPPPAMLTAMDQYSNVVTTFNTAVSAVNVSIETFPPECPVGPVINGFNDVDATPAVLDDPNDFTAGVAQLVGGASNNAMRVNDGCPGLYRFRFQRADNLATGLSEFILLEDPGP
jgi:hypothetical protein